MAKTKGPLFSQEAHGSLAKILTYSKRKSGQQARKINKPTGPPSMKQISHRRLVFFIMLHWRYMDTAEKATWATNAKATGGSLSGYNYFLQQALLAPYLYHGLEFYLPMNEQNGATLLDYSGLERNCILKPNYPVDNPRIITAKIPAFGKAFRFDGFNDYIDGQNFNFTSDKLTLLVWIKPAALGSGMNNTPFITKWADCYLLGTKNDTTATPWFLTRNAANLEVRSYAAAGLPAANEWYFIVGRYDGANMTCYVNMIAGTPVAQTGNVKERPRLLRLGEYGTGGPHYGGVLDEPCIYSRLLPLAELQARYDAGRG